jgi:hypothetical protein
MDNEHFYLPDTIHPGFYVQYGVYLTTITRTVLRNI